MNCLEIMIKKFSKKKELEQQLRTLQEAFDDVKTERDQLAQEV